jgi:hypothetical protein
MGDIYDPPEQVAFNTVTELAPGTGLCLVFQFASGGVAGVIRYEASGAFPSGSHMVKTTNAGASWTKPSGQSVWFKVYGTVKTSGTTPADGTKLEWMRFSIVAGQDAATRIDTAVQMLNRPELTTP